MAVTASKETGAQSWVPTRKLQFGGGASALSVVLVWLYNTYVAPSGQPMSAEVASAITTVVGVLVSYFTPPSPDQIVLPSPEPVGGATTAR